MRRGRCGVTELRGASVFVFGASGFLGQRLIARLLAQGARVGAMVLPGERITLPPEVQVTRGEIDAPAAVQQAIRRFAPTHVVNLAAVGVTRPHLPLADALRVNVGGTVNVLEAVRARSEVQRVMLVGSSYEYGARRTATGLDPFNAYSASKVAAWAFARAAYNAWGTPMVWVRPFQIYGPGQHPRALIPAAIEAARQGADFPMTGGEQQRDFIYVEDVIAGLCAALTAPGIAGRSLDLGTGKLHRLREVVALIWELAQAGGRILTGALPYRPGEVPAIPANAALTRRLTGWSAQTPLEAGLRLTLAARL